MIANGSHFAFRQSNDAGYVNYLYVGGAGYLAPLGAPFNETIDSAGSDISGEFYSVPILVLCYVATDIVYGGQLVDIKWAPGAASVAMGTVEPGTGATTSAIIGTCWIPNGGTNPAF